MKTVAILANTKRTFHNLNLEKQVNTLEREGEGGRGRERKGKEEEGGVEGEGRGGWRGSRTEGMKRARQGCFPADIRQL